VVQEIIKTLCISMARLSMQASAYCFLKSSCFMMPEAETQDLQWTHGRRAGCQPFRTGEQRGEWNVAGGYWE
jgi:hypothetical protein